MTTPDMPRRALFALAIALVATSMATSSVLAATGVWYDLPNSLTADGDARFTDYYAASGGTIIWGEVRFNRVGSSPYCTYIQAKPVMRLSPDGGWFVLTPVRCEKTSTKIKYAWNRSFNRNWDGMKFRLCRDNPAKAFQDDPCAEGKNVYLT
jgi:hypothetical protein